MIRLAVVALLAAAGLGVAAPASASAPSCLSHDALAARFRAEGFPAPAANNFARLTAADCAA